MVLGILKGSFRVSTGVSRGKVSSVQKVSGDLCWGFEGPLAFSLYKRGVRRALEGGGGGCMEGVVESLRVFFYQC